MTTDEARKFQFQVLELVREYNGTGAGYDELAKCLINIASIMAVHADIKLAESMKIFETLYNEALVETPPLLKN